MIAIAERARDMVDGKTEVAGSVQFKIALALTEFAEMESLSTP